MRVQALQVELAVPASLPPSRVAVAVAMAVAVGVVWRLRGVLTLCAASSSFPLCYSLLSPLVKCVSAVVTTPGLFLLFSLERLGWALGKLVPACDCSLCDLG